MSWTWSTANESTSCDLHTTCLLSQVHTARAWRKECFTRPHWHCLWKERDRAPHWTDSEHSYDSVGCGAIGGGLCSAVEFSVFMCCVCMSLHKVTLGLQRLGVKAFGWTAPQSWHWLRTQMTLKSTKQSPALFLKFKQTGFSRGTKQIWQFREKNLRIKIKIPP